MSGHGNEAGKSASEGFRKSAEREERKVEEQKGGDLKKGADRFTERSESADKGGTGPNDSMNKV